MQFGKNKELSCPLCKGPLIYNNILTCRACRSSFELKDGIIDFRHSRKDYYFNPIPINKMTELIDRMKIDNWEQIIREFLDNVSNVSDWMDNLINDGRYAWKIFLNLNKDSVILDFGCGLGNLSHNIAPHVGTTYAMDLTWDRLKFAYKRFEKFNSEDEIILMAGGDSKYLPFCDGALDCVILSGVLEWIPDANGLWNYNINKFYRFLLMIFSCFGGNNPYKIQLEFLKEIKRIIKPEGQIFIAIENRFNYEYFTGRPDHHTYLKYGSLLPRFLSNIYSILKRRKPYRNYTYSMSGYKKLLKKAEFKKAVCYALSPGYSKLNEIFPASLDKYSWHPPIGNNLKEKIKHNKRFVPAFGIVGYASSEFHTSLIDKLLSKINQSLSKRFDNRIVTILDYTITRKNKGVINGMIGDNKIIIKLPFNKIVICEEENNVKFLKMIRKSPNKELPVFPENYTNGEVNKLRYFVEERVDGLPLGKLLNKYGRTAYLNQIEKVLEKINPQPYKNIKNLINSLYDNEVNNRLEKLFQIISNKRVRDELGLFFYNNLYGIELYTGIEHGDFSTSNIIVDHNMIKGVIDWGMFSINGFPILDVLNYFDSVNMLFHADLSFLQRIKLLFSGQMHVSDEHNFLIRQYERYSIEEQYRKAMVYLYWLRHVTTQLPHGLCYQTSGIKLKIEEIVNSLLSSDTMTV